MHDRVDHGFKHRSPAVLRRIYSRRRLACRNAHVADHELHRVSDLHGKRSCDFLCVQLAGGAVRAAIVGRHDSRLRQPVLGRVGAEQHASDRGPVHVGFIGRQKPKVHQSPARVSRSRHTEQWFPKTLVEGLEAGLRNNLPVEPEVAAPGASLRQPQTFVAAEAAFGCADPDECATGPLVHGIAPRHIHEYEGPAVEFSMMHVDAEGRFHRVRAHFDQQVVKSGHLLPGHTLNSTTVGNPAKKHAPVRVGEGRHLIGEIVSPGAGRAVVTKLDLLEFPAAVLAQAQTLADFRVGDVHFTCYQAPGLVCCRQAGKRGHFLPSQRLPATSTTSETSTPTRTGSMNPQTKKLVPALSSRGVKS